MSLGVNLLTALSQQAAKVLGDQFDIEIIEKHHNQKVDAPSGTAIMLAEAINKACDDRYIFEYDCHSCRMKRPKNEIGMHSIRAGSIVGEHEVLLPDGMNSCPLSTPLHPKKFLRSVRSMQLHF